MTYSPMVVRVSEASAQDEPLLADDPHDGGGMAAPIMSVVPSQKPAQGGTVQFESSLFIADEDDGTLCAFVTRMGGLGHECSVCWYTEEASAKNGEVFHSASGKLHFGEWEEVKPIEIDLIQNEHWSATLEFKLHLTSAENCNLGKYFKMARVKVMDGDYFPAEKFRGQKEADLPGFPLLWSYMWWNYCTAGVERRTWTTLGMDQLKNVYCLATIYANMYLVNVVCNTHDEVEDQLILPNREANALFVSLVIVVPFILLHMWERARVKLDLAGVSQGHVQRSMFRKYLNLSDKGKREVQPEKFEQVVMVDAPAVAAGYESAVMIVEILGQTCMNLYFVLVESPTARIFAMFIPIFVAAWGWYRTQINKGPNEKKELLAMSRHMQETVRNYDTIASYFLRPQANDVFAERCGATGTKQNQKALHLCTTNFVVTALEPVCLGAYIVVAVPHIVSGHLRLGTFLAAMGAISSIVKESFAAFTTFRTLTACFGPLRELTYVLNRETDIGLWKAACSARRATTASFCKTPGVDYNTLPIRLTNMGFQIANGPTIFDQVNIDAFQGKMVVVAGPHGSGKTTLLRMLGQQIFPHAGTVFLPSHLRVLYVHQHGQLFTECSLVQNLTLGVERPTKEELRRASLILEELHLDDLHEVFKAEVEDKKVIDPHVWIKQLNATEIDRLGLARALVLNPEIMVLHKPLNQYQKEMRETISKLLADHVRLRGLAEDPAKFESRRPRTVFYSAETQNISEADIVWSLVQKEQGNPDSPWAIHSKPFRRAEGAGGP